MGIRDVERNKKSSTDYADPVNINVSVITVCCKSGEFRQSLNEEEDINDHVYM